MCDHSKIDHDENGWRCASCGMKFFPEYVVAGVIEAEREEATTMASAIIWELHRRSMAAPDVGINDQEGEHDHVWGDDNKCHLCGARRFLGGD